MAEDFEITIITITKQDAGPDAKAPAVYLNDVPLAEIKGIRDGKISEHELFDELVSAKIPRRHGNSCCMHTRG